MPNLPTRTQTQYGYLISVFGVSLILIWLGIYKFTPTEAKLIEPLVLNHPLDGLELPNSLCTSRFEFSRCNRNYGRFRFTYWTSLF